MYMHAHAVVGVDLGTTYSVVAISQKNNVTVIPDEFGHVIIPSIVAFLPGGDVLVGRQARAHRTKDPKHTIFNAKRFIGRTCVRRSSSFLGVHTCMIAHALWLFYAMHV